MRLVTLHLVSGCSSSGPTDRRRLWCYSTSMDLECEVSVASPTTERGIFRVGSVRSITAGLSFRFRALISLIRWNMVSFTRSLSSLPLEARGLVQTPPCSPGAAVRKGKRSCLTINNEGLVEDGGLITPGWVKDEEVTLPVSLNSVPNHRPRMTRVLEHHQHTFRHGHNPI